MARGDGRDICYYPFFGGEEGGEPCVWHFFGEVGQIFSFIFFIFFIFQGWKISIFVLAGNR